MANYWRKEYPSIGWAVFPEATWKIEDFWDAEDIHIYTPKLCREALQFLARDNLWTAKKFAEDWARAHPNHLAATFGKSSMADVYDLSQPLAIVDKIFVYGEHNLFPRQFLYRAADMLRAAMIEDEARKNDVVATTNFASPPTTSKLPKKLQETVKPPSKKNRKKSRSRPLTVSTEPASRPYRRQEPTIPHVENFQPRGVIASRGPLGPFPPVHTPHMSHVSTTMGRGQPPMVPLHHPAQLHPVFPPPNLPPPHPHMTPGYGPRDVTNTAYYGPRSPYMDPHHTGRREKSYGTLTGHNTLYDPYNGAKPAFSDYGTGRKSSRNGYMEQSAGRKPSVQGLRPRVSSSGTDWGDRLQRHHHHHQLKDDPAITGDAIRGCGHTWIGPENHDVNELFIGDLPENIQPREIEIMFSSTINIAPARVIVKTPSFSTRAHAFVM